MFSEEPGKWPKSVVDVGCGIGGSSRYLAKKFGARCVGITLSPVQAERANALAAAQGLADKVFMDFFAFIFYSAHFMLSCLKNGFGFSNVAYDAQTVDTALKLASRQW